MAPTLTRLPLARWARHLSGGTLRVVGTLPEGLDRDGMVIGAGPVRVELVFEGGEAPRIAWARLSGDVRVDGLPADEEVLRDPRWIGGAQAVVDQLCDVEIEARAEPREQVELRLTEDLRLAVQPEIVVTISGAAAGPPADLRLTRPLVMGFSGSGVQLQHGGLERLSRLADVRLVRATLHPDGLVRLEGRATRGLSLAVRGGLTTASVKVTRMVRRGERFRSLRPFLRLDELGE